MKRVFFEVRFDKAERGWRIYRDGKVMPSMYFTKFQAVQEAIQEMRQEVRSELKIKNKQGRICERRTWPRKSDPKGRG